MTADRDAYNHVRERDGGLRKMADSPELTPERLLEMYAKMLLSRRLDERMWVLHRQGKIAFHISGLGQEGAQVGAAYALKPGFDFVHPYYRGMALALSLGMTPRELMLAVCGKQGEPSSGARQMPAHYGARRLNIVSGSLFATPIIAQPNVAILGVGAIQKRVVVLGDAIAIRPMVYIELTFDHRVLDGASGDAFAAKIKETLESWASS
jgi:TPP-dependent pyruvate/acetoin dehydrogenase alpha subunit